MHWKGIPCLIATALLGVHVCSGGETPRVDFDLHPLFLREGEERVVSCTVQESPLFLLTNPVSFMYYRDEDPGWMQLTSNGRLTVDEEEFANFGVYATATRDTVTFNLVFKNPRTGWDDGTLECRVTFGNPDLWDNAASVSRQRTVRTFTPE